MRKIYNFGTTLRALRTEKKWNQRKLGEMVSVSESMISRYENGEIYPPFETLTALASVLRVSLDELCGTGKEDTLSLYGLNDSKKECVIELTTIMRNKELTTKKELSSKHYEILGKIVAELIK